MTTADQRRAEAGAASARAEAVLTRLQLLVTRKLDGLLQGDYVGLLPGPGSEPGESREYRPGDDVRRMDWPVTARTTAPHVRRTVADRELETWMAVDLSASLDFGTARWLKRDLVVAAATAVAHLTVRGGNRIGAVVGTGSGGAPAPPRRPGPRPPPRPGAPRARPPPWPAAALSPRRPAGPRTPPGRSWSGCPPAPAARRRRGCSGRSPVPRSGPAAPTSARSSTCSTGRPAGAASPSSSPTSWPPSTPGPGR